MRRSDAGKPTARHPRESTKEPELTQVATAEEAKQAADRAIERNREALTELARW